MKENKEKQKKETEKRYLLKLKKLLPDFPEGEIVPIYGKKEPPDFKVGNTGIEVTEIHGEKPQNHFQPKQIKEFEQGLVLDIQKRFEQTLKTPLMVDIGFREGLHLKRESRQKFINQAVELIRNIAHKKNTGENFRETINRPEITGNGIDYITIHYSINLSTPLWQDGGGFWVPNPSVARLPQ